MAEPSESSGSEPVRDPRPWWRRPTNQRWGAGIYLLLGLGQLVGAIVSPHGDHWVIGGMWLLAGLLLLVRARTVLDHDALRVPVRWWGRRRVELADVERFAVPHPFAVSLIPCAVLRDGTRLPLRDVDVAVLQRWSEATGIPVVRDPKPPPPPPSQRAALS